MKRLLSAAMAVIALSIPAAALAQAQNAPAPANPAQQAVQPPQRPAPPSMNLNINSDPSGAGVFIDGRNMGKTPLQLKNFTPGEHVLRIAKEGYIDAETTVALVPNETRNIKLVLEELPETREKRLRMQSAQDHYEAAMEEYRAIAKPKQIAGWTLLGTGLGAAGAAAALYAVGWVNAEDNYSKYSKTVNQDKMNRYWGNVQDGETLITVGHVMTAATVVLIGTSIYFFATIPKKPVEPKVVKYIPVPSIVNGMPYIGWGTEF